MEPSFVADNDDNEPSRLPIGVLATPTIHTSVGSRNDDKDQQKFQESQICIYKFQGANRIFTGYVLTISFSIIEP